MLVSLKGDLYLNNVIHVPVSDVMRQRNDTLSSATTTTALPVFPPVCISLSACPACAKPSYRCSRTVIFFWMMRGTTSSKKPGSAAAEGPVKQMYPCTVRLRLKICSKCCRYGNACQRTRGEKKCLRTLTSLPSAAALIAPHAYRTWSVSDDVQG